MGLGLGIKHRLEPVLLPLKSFTCLSFDSSGGASRYRWKVCGCPLKVWLHFAKVNYKTAKCTTCKTVMGEEERLRVMGGIGICSKPTETDAQFQQKAVNRLNTFCFRSCMVESIIFFFLFILNGGELLPWGPDQWKSNEQIAPPKA